MTELSKYFKIKLDGVDRYCEVDPPTTAEIVEELLGDLITKAVPVSEKEYRAQN